MKRVLKYKYIYTCWQRTAGHCVEQQEVSEKTVECEFAVASVTQRTALVVVQKTSQSVLYCIQCLS